MGWKGLHLTEWDFLSSVILGSVGCPGSSLGGFAVVELLSYDLEFQTPNGPTVELAAVLLSVRCVGYCSVQRETHWGVRKVNCPLLGLGLSQQIRWNWNCLQ